VTRSGALAWAKARRSTSTTRYLTAKAEPLPAAATITVNGSNDNPTATENTFTTTEDAIQTATTVATAVLAGNVLTSGTPDSDPDGDSLSVTTTTAPTIAESDAQLSITSITLEPAVAGEAARYQILTNSGTAHLALLNNGDVKLWSTAGDPFQGLGTTESATINFTYTISDGNGGTSSAAAAITVNGSNDNPTASNVSQAVADTALINEGTVVGSGNLVTSSAATDVDGDTPLTISSIQGIADGWRSPLRQAALSRTAPMAI
jgi:VCBS repeat-containing protein